MSHDEGLIQNLLKDHTRIRPAMTLYHLSLLLGTFVLASERPRSGSEDGERAPKRRAPIPKRGAAFGPWPIPPPVNIGNHFERLPSEIIDGIVSRLGHLHLQDFGLTCKAFVEPAQRFMAAPCPDLSGDGLAGQGSLPSQCRC